MRQRLTTSYDVSCFFVLLSCLVLVISLCNVELSDVSDYDKDTAK